MMSKFLNGRADEGDMATPNQERRTQYPNTHKERGPTRQDLGASVSSWHNLKGCTRVLSCKGTNVVVEAVWATSIHRIVNLRKFGREEIKSRHLGRY